jgi:prepilin-type N-terminal cleavage/methylation domain-containing protein
MTKRQSGFTLVELAIVLVVIGALIILIFKGQEMIVQSRIKNVIRDFDGVASALEVYQGTYRAMPGDDANAMRWPGIVAGNGDRRLNGTYSAVASNPATSDQETNLFWWHMRRSGFLAVDADVSNHAIQPVNAAGGQFGIQEADGALGLSGVVLCTDVSGKYAIGIDLALDDGNPSTGAVRAMLGTYGTPLSATPAATYVENNTDTYIVCRLATRLR